MRQSSKEWTKKNLWKTAFEGIFLKGFSRLKQIIFPQIF